MKFSSLVFFIVILPLSTSTFSLKVNNILAVLDTLVALSVGILDDKVGAAVQEEGTLAPHLGSLDETKPEPALKFFGFLNNSH